MSLVQAYSRPADTSALRPAAAWPRVWDDMTVEVALSVMAAARTGHLAVCDEDGRCTDVVTRDGLTAVRDGSAYTDRVRLRDIAGVADDDARRRARSRQWSE
ncbi:CBS domain-containing protein [Streptomyces sp. NPDC088106]|uniref:CBS domain-containing protein n=2 Tax=unclassified Streptomyces TaxID=2593676 RepID=UPI0034240AD2